MAPECSLMLTPEEYEVRKSEVKKMLPPYYDVHNDICKEIYMLDDEAEEKEGKKGKEVKKGWMKC
jgi:hypothetical protein